MSPATVLGGALLLCSCASDGVPASDADESSAATGDAAMDSASSEGTQSDGSSDDTAVDDGTTGDTSAASDDSDDYEDSTGESTSESTGESTGGFATCGDRVLSPEREECEPGLALPDSCESLGFEGGTLQCSDRCGYDTSACFVCGDGVLADAEVCEPDVELSESCDSLGFDGGVLACAADCSLDTSECFTCGNDVLESGEDCEANLEINQACTDLGFDGGTLACTTGCSYDTSGCFECGNGVLDPGEACDGEAYPAGASFLDNCAGYGHTGGILGCTNECTIDDSACTDIPLPLPGELIVTEVRKPPLDVGGAWFELHNLTDGDRQLNTCVAFFLMDGFYFLDEFVVGPGEYAVVGTTDPATGIMADYELVVPLAGPFSQSINLSCGGDSVDAVGLDFLDGVNIYDEIDGVDVELAPGASMQLDPSQFDTTANSLGTNWCASTSPIPGGTGFGTPGAPNDDC